MNLYSLLHGGLISLWICKKLYRGFTGELLMDCLICFAPVKGVWFSTDFSELLRWETERCGLTIRIRRTIGCDAEMGIDKSQTAY